MEAAPQPLPDPPPAFAVRLAFRLRRLLLRLADALVPAQLSLFERVTGVCQTGMLSLAAHQRFADLLEAGPLSAQELAQRTALDADVVQRVLRALVSQGVFAREPDGRFANNRVSRGLLSEIPASMRPFCDYMGSRSNLDSWTDLRATARTGQSAFERVHGVDVWTWFDKHPEERAVFAEAMVALTELDAPAIARAYPIDELRRICDVGGGRGQLLSELLRQSPQLTGVLCDAPGVLDGARTFLEAQGVAQRVQLVPANFFERVPTGCDAYLLKDILHDWDDAHALQILGRVREAAAPGARLLIAEIVVESDTLEGPGPMVDVHMMSVCVGGRQRGRAEFASLMERSGFRLRRIVPTALALSVVEGVAI